VETWLLFLSIVTKCWWLPQCKHWHTKWFCKGGQKFVAQCIKWACMMIRLWPQWWNLIPGKNRGFFFLLALGPTHWVSGAFFIGVKAPRPEADHTHLVSNVSLKNTWSNSSTPLYMLIAWWLIKNRNKSIRYNPQHKE
jgi:hypothetical protein